MTIENVVDDVSLHDPMPMPFATGQVGIVMPEIAGVWDNEFIRDDE